MLLEEKVSVLTKVWSVCSEAGIPIAKAKEPAEIS
jgi:hypothetical protein